MEGPSPPAGPDTGATFATPLADPVFSAWLVQWITHRLCTDGIGMVNVMLRMSLGRRPLHEAIHEQIVDTVATYQRALLGELGPDIKRKALELYQTYQDNHD